MTLISAHFLINNITGEERFVKDLPLNYQFAPGERLVLRQISQQDYNLLMNDKFRHIKVYRFINSDSIPDKRIPPKGLDYKIGLNTRLYEDAYINTLGFLERMDFYASATYDTTNSRWVFLDKVITENYHYTIDPRTKYVVARTKQIIWYKEDGTAHSDIKIMFKPYTIMEMEEEAIRRRSNIITGIKIELAKFANYIVKSQYPDPNNRPDSNEVVKKISAPFNLPMRSYIDAGDRDTLLEALAKSQDPFFNYIIPWFGQTVKESCISRIS